MEHYDLLYADYAAAADRMLASLPHILLATLTIGYYIVDGSDKASGHH